MFLCIMALKPSIPFIRLAFPMHERARANRFDICFSHGCVRPFWLKCKKSESLDFSRPAVHNSWAQLSPCTVVKKRRYTILFGLCIQGITPEVKQALSDVLIAQACSWYLQLRYTREYRTIYSFIDWGFSRPSTVFLIHL